MISESGILPPISRPTVLPVKARKDNSVRETLDSETEAAIEHACMVIANVDLEAGWDDEWMQRPREQIARDSRETLEALFERHSRLLAEVLRQEHARLEARFSVLIQQELPEEDDHYSNNHAKFRVPLPPTGPESQRPAEGSGEDNVWPNRAVMLPTGSVSRRPGSGCEQRTGAESRNAARVATSAAGSSISSTTRPKMSSKAQAGRQASPPAQSDDGVIAGSSNASPRSLQSKYSVWDRISTAPTFELLKDIIRQMNFSFARLPSLEQSVAQGKHLKIKRLVRSPFFSLTSGLLIVANAVFLGLYSSATIKTELGRLEGESSQQALAWWIRHIFNMLFFIDVLLRIAAHKIYYIFGDNGLWNIFDLIVVLGPYVYACCLGSASLTEFLKSVPCYSVFRIVRIFNVITTYDFFRRSIFSGLRMMTNSMIKSLPSFVWAALLGCFWIYIFGVGFLVAIAGHLQAMETSSDGAEQAPQLSSHFSSLGVTMKSLFMAISGGIDWNLIFDSVADLSWTLQLSFVLYITFMVYAMLNIVTGLFIERALKVVKQDRDHGIIEEQHDLQFYERRLFGLFNRLDKDVNGRLDWNEFQAVLENPHVQAYFNWLDIDIIQAKNVFHLLDTNGNGTLSVEEFLIGCRELRGRASTIDMKMLRIEFKALLSQHMEALASSRQNPDPALQSCKSVRKAAVAGLAALDPDSATIRRQTPTSAMLEAEIARARRVSWTTAGSWSNQARNGAVSQSVPAKSADLDHSLVSGHGSALTCKNVVPYLPLAETCGMKVRL